MAIGRQLDALGLRVEIGLHRPDLRVESLDVFEFGLRPLLFCLSLLRIRQFFPQ